MRQTLGNLGLKGIGRNLTVGSIISAKVLLIVDLAYEDNHFLQTLNLEHHVLNLTQLDAQSAQFDLVVVTSQDHDIAVRQPLGIVARLVDAHAVVVNEAFLGHLVKVVVAMSHATAADVQFTHNAHRQFVAVLVHDKLDNVQLGFAHGYHLGIGQFLVVRRHGNLGGAVAVEDAGLGDLADLSEQLVREFLATGTHDVDAADGITEVLTRQPRHPARRRARYHVDVLLVDELCQIKRVVGLLLGSDNQRLAVEIGRTDVLQGGIKRDGRHAQDALGIGHHSVGKYIGGMAVEVVADAAMMQHHALGTARRSTGVNQVSQVFGSNVRNTVFLLSGNQVLDVDGLVGGNAVHAVCCGDDVTRLAVLKDEFHTVGGILGIAGDVSSTRLQNTEQGEYQAARARQEQGDTVTSHHATALQGSSDAGSYLVHFLIGKSAVDGNQRLVVGLRLGKVTDALVEERERRFACRSLSQVAQFLLLVLAHDGQLSQFCLRLFHHPVGDGNDAFGQALANSFAVNRVVILNDYAIRLDLDVDFELGNVEFQQFLVYRLAVHGVLREHTYLIGVGDCRAETIIGGDAGKGIVLVPQGLVERVAGILQELADGYIVDAHAQCQGVDKHTHGVGNLQVAASAAHGAQIDITVVGIA